MHMYLSYDATLNSIIYFKKEIKYRDTALLP